MRRPFPPFSGPRLTRSPQSLVAQFPTLQFPTLACPPRREPVPSQVLFSTGFGYANPSQGAKAMVLNRSVDPLLERPDAAWRDTEDKLAGIENATMRR